jgi:hypothetical protein
MNRVFTEVLPGNSAERCLPQRCVATSAARCGAARLGSSRHGENTAFLIVALRVFGREVFNGQLPSNALTIHVTIYHKEKNKNFN